VVKEGVVRGRCGEVIVSLLEFEYTDNVLE
jgi:hypothetical protein